VEIEKIVGYDVSEDMINFGQGRNEHYPQVDFKKKNIETEYDDIAQYDVAYCLFGLHWMSNIDHVVHCISLSLKPKGIFLSLTPIGNHELFEIRTAFVNNSKWTEALAVEARTLHRFH
jgi:2-polyprenyl-3-methyl-5-hydroxy-6-metoxy-1,4-benzoquinol methylase